MVVMTPSQEGLDEFGCYAALRISAASDAVEEGPVGFAGVEEHADAVAGECRVSTFLAQSAV